MVLRAFFVVLQLLLWIDICIAELEHIVLEVLQDGCARLEVDWSLLDAVADDTLILLLEQVVVGSEPVVLGKLTWPLIKCIRVIFTVIVIVVALFQTTGCLGASWHAANDWHFDAIKHFGGRTLRRVVLRIELEQVEFVSPLCAIESTIFTFNLWRFEISPRVLRELFFIRVWLILALLSSHLVVSLVLGTILSILACVVMLTLSLSRAISSNKVELDLFVLWNLIFLSHELFLVLARTRLLNTVLGD